MTTNRQLTIALRLSVVAALVATLGAQTPAAQAALRARVDALAAERLPAADPALAVGMRAMASVVLGYLYGRAQ